MCVQHLSMMSYDVSYVDVLLKRVLSMVLVLWGVGPILRNGYGNQGQKVCCISPGE